MSAGEELDSLPDWHIPRDTIFDSYVKLANGVDTLNCVVRVNETGNFCIGIANSTIEDMELGQGLVLGMLKPVQHLGPGQTI